MLLILILCGITFSFLVDLFIAPAIVKKYEKMLYKTMDNLTKSF